jgi:hypothetical protein
LPVGLFLPINRFPSAAYADGCYEQAGIGESPPSSDARHFFLFSESMLASSQFSETSESFINSRISRHAFARTEINSEISFTNRAST